MKGQLSNCLAFVGIIMMEKLSNHFASRNTYVQLGKQDGRINTEKKKKAFTAIICFCKRIPFFSSETLTQFQRSKLLLFCYKKLYVV